MDCDYIVFRSRLSISCAHVLLIVLFYDYLFFFFKQKTAYEMRISDWSSDVCSSDLRGIICTVRLPACRCSRSICTSTVSTWITAPPPPHMSTPSSATSTGKWSTGAMQRLCAAAAEAHRSGFTPTAARHLRSRPQRRQVRGSDAQMKSTTQITLL